MTAIPSVLIVEDELLVADDLRFTIQSMGYGARVADSADRALALASELCPDLVLMDIRIRGDRDGVETAKLLRAHFGVPVVFLTAHADAKTVQRASQSEPHGYLVKPVRSAELRATIEVALHKYRLEHELQKRERWFATTLSSIGDAVVTVDLAGKVTYLNEAAEQLMGKKLAEVEGQSARDVLVFTDGQARPFAENPLDQVLRSRQKLEVPEAGLTNATTGALRTIADSVAPVVDRGVLLGAVMVFRDVTDQHTARKQLELADRLASLGTMAAGVAHEINNPLAVVLSNSGFIETELNRMQNEPALATDVAWREEMRVAAEDLKSASTRIQKIVADLHIFSRPVNQAAGDCDVGRCLDWAVRTTAYAFRRRPPVKLELGELRPVSGDETRISQVFVNLVLNAAQALPVDEPSRSVTIRAKTVGEQVVVEVQDEGKGMTPEVMRHVFEPFFTTRAPDGTGLGLSVCHGIVTSLGGQIQVESQVGKGSLFRVMLPISRDE